MIAVSARPGCRLSALLDGLATVEPGMDRLVDTLVADSRRVTPGALFLAWQGGHAHGLDHWRQALAQGAALVICEPGRHWPRARIEGLRPTLSTPLIVLDDLRGSLSLLAGRLLGHPSRALRLIGVTGTNGKTSCAHFIAQALAPDAPCGVIGTLGNGFVGELQPGHHTTPDALALQSELKGMHERGARAVTLEVSSHALDQGRVAALHFDTAIFTNLTQDHLDYHGTMEAYLAAKTALFRQPELRLAVINLADPAASTILAETGPAVRRVVYAADGLREVPATAAGWCFAERVETDLSGMEIQVRSAWGDGLLRTPLLGRFNAANLLAVLAVLLESGLGMAEALRRLAHLTPVPGRMECQGGDGRPLVVVDFAHTPDALEQALGALRAHCRARLTCVFGCGGERDQGKRPLMGRIAERLADRVVITDDNPRSENGDHIIQQILGGMERPGQARVERNRAMAIRHAVADAGAEEIVLIAGKGHETTQQLGELKVPFCDRHEVQNALRGLIPRTTG